jgi:zinc protease
MTWLLTSALAAPVRLAPPVLPPSPPQYPEIVQFELSSGAPVRVLERHEVPLVRVELAVRWPGNLADTEDQLLAGLAGELMGAGTEQRSGAEFQEALDLLGASWGIGVAMSSLWADVEVPTGKLGPALDLMVEALTQPVFDGRAARLELDRWASWREDLWLDIRRSHNRALNHAWFPAGHPVRHTATPKDIRGLQEDEALSLVREILATGRAQVVVVGDTTPAEVLPLIEAAYGRFSGTEDSVDIPDPPRTSSTWLVARSGFDVAEVSVLTPGPAVGAEDLVEVRALMALLAGTFTSRLSRDLREERGLCYGVNGSVKAWNGTGQLEITVEAQWNRAVEAMLAMEQHLDLVEAEGVTQAELDQARNHLLLENGRALETTRRAATMLTSLLLRGRELSDVSNDLRRLMELTPADVALAARKYLVPEHRVWVLTGDRGDLEIQLEEAHRVPDRIVSAETLSEEP